MKDLELADLIVKASGALDQAINAETDIDRNCRLQNVQEHLRRATLTLLCVPFEGNDLIPHC